MRAIYNYALSPTGTVLIIVINISRELMPNHPSNEGRPVPQQWRQHRLMQMQYVYAAGACNTNASPAWSVTSPKATESLKQKKNF